MPIEERLFPKEMSQPIDVIARHYQRYLNAVLLLGQSSKTDIWSYFGCGSGYGTQLLSNFVGKIYGLDNNSQALEYAQKEYSGDNIVYVSSLGQIHESLHAAFCIETIEHVDPEAAAGLLGDIHKILKPEGRLIISTPIVEHTNQNPKNPHHKIEYSKPDFLDLLEKSGFHVDKESLEQVTFTDGENKMQGMFRCHI